MPTQTNCNRAFAGSGNSIGNLNGKITGMVDNHWGLDWDHPWDPVEFTGRTLWNVLNDNKYTTPDDWSIFYSQLWLGHDLPGDYCYTQDLFWPSLQNDTDHCRPIQTFFDLAAAGKLPKFSYVEPAWFQEIDGMGYNGNDYHPPGNLLPGEQFLVKLYGALKNSPGWNNTLFIINFDEHGGTYDHQAPPWGATPSWANPADGTAVPQITEYGFQFNRFGVRVPLILVSPYIQSGTIFRSSTSVPFDHTSVIATILNHFAIPKSKWKLGSRVANAPTFENALTLDKPRTDNQEPMAPPATKLYSEDTVANDLQLMIIHRMMARVLQKVNYPKDKFQSLYDEHFKNRKTFKQLKEAVAEALKIVSGQK